MGHSNAIIARPAQAETNCIECGYDLRAHSRDERCPECGTPVRVSLEGNGLAGMDRSWVRSLRHGALILAISACVLCVISSLRLGLVLQFNQRRATFSLEYRNLFNAEVAALLPFALGIILLSRKRPSRTTAAPDFLIRQASRFALAVPFLLLIALECRFWLPPTHDFYFGFTLLSTSLLLLLYLRRLWEMVPSARGRRFASAACSVLSVWMIILAATMFIAPSSTASSTTTGSPGSRPPSRGQSPTPPKILAFWPTLPGGAFAASMAGFWFATRRFTTNKPSDAGLEADETMKSSVPI